MSMSCALVHKNFHLQIYVFSRILILFESKENRINSSFSKIRMVSYPNAVCGPEGLKVLFWR